MITQVTGNHGFLGFIVFLLGLLADGMRPLAKTSLSFPPVPASEPQLLCNTYNSQGAIAQSVHLRSEHVLACAGLIVLKVP